MALNDRQVTIQLSEATYERLTELAESQSRKVSPMIRILVEERLEQLDSSRTKRRRA